MTKEERNDAIEFFKKVAEKEADNTKYSKLAIEALEQESNKDDDEIDFIPPKKIIGKLISMDILDKIRSEVAAISIRQVDQHIMFIRTGEQVKQIVLEIIDKYKAESKNK